MADTPLDFGDGPSNDIIESQKAIGQRTFEKQRYGKPRFGFPDISADQVDRDRLLNALLGASAGAQAANGAQHPLAALAMGLGGGIGSPQAGDYRAKRQGTQQDLMAQQQKMAEDQLNLTPVGQAAPQMVEALKAKYGMDVSEIPLGQFQKFSGLLQHSQDLERQLQLVRARAAGMASKSGMSPEARKMLAELSGIPENELPASLLEAQRLGITPKPLAGAQLQVYANVSQGADDLNRAIALYDKVDDKTRKFAAVDGVTGKAMRVGNENAQELNRLIQNAGDVLTRQRTGAALNETEVVYYGNLLNDWRRSNGQNRKALSDFLSFYNKVQKEIESGQRGAGTQVLQRGRQQNQQQAPSYSQTATNPKTGQRIGLNASGQWEVIK